MAHIDEIFDKQRYSLMYNHTIDDKTIGIKQYGFMSRYEF